MGRGVSPESGCASGAARHSFEDETMRTSGHGQLQASWERTRSSVINYCHLEATPRETRLRLRMHARYLQCGKKRAKKNRKLTIFWIKI